MSDASIQYELLRPEQIVRARERAPILYIPIGPLEWHGPHLPFGTDMLHAQTMALEAAKRSGGLVLPPLPLGTETFFDVQRLRDRGFRGDERIFGMDYPGFILPSLYIEESVMGVLMHDLIRAVKAQGFKVIVIVNGHGAYNHLSALQRIARETSVPGEVTVLTTGFRFDTEYREHAAIRETAYVLAFHTQSADVSALPTSSEPLPYKEYGILDGPVCMGEPSQGFAVRSEEDPRAATADLGRRDVEGEGRRIGEKALQALEELKKVRPQV
jgi:creatinine amidohydrolase